MTLVYHYISPASSRKARPEIQPGGQWTNKHCSWKQACEQNQLQAHPIPYSGSNGSGNVIACSNVNSNSLRQKSTYRFFWLERTVYPLQSAQDSRSLLYHCSYLAADEVVATSFLQGLLQVLQPAGTTQSVSNGNAPQEHDGPKRRVQYETGLSRQD